MATLEQYQKHLEKFGDDCLLETAAQDGNLGMFELSHLKSLVEFQNRNFIWTGDKWNAKRGAQADTGADATELKSMGYTPIRECARPGCKIDVPASRSSRSEYHSDACKQQAYRERKNAERLAAKRAARSAE